LILEFADKVNWDWISSRQNLSTEFIDKNEDRLSTTKLIEGDQVLSEEYCSKHNVFSDILASEHQCGPDKRTIYRTKSEPELMTMYCIKGTRNEIISVINKEYEGQEREDYVSKVNKCFSV